jgi:hypothetical protein
MHSAVWSAPLVLLGEKQQSGVDAAAGDRLVGQVELREDGVDVLLDGPLGEDERLGDRGVALAVGDLGEDLALTAGQRGQRRALDAQLGGDERFDGLGVQYGAAGRDGLDRRD